VIPDFEVAGFFVGHSCVLDLRIDVKILLPLETRRIGDGKNSGFAVLPAIRET